MEPSSDPKSTRTGVQLLHDLKAPLNMIALHLELTKRRLATKDPAELARVDESLALMKQEVKRLDRMLHELLMPPPDSADGGRARKA